MMQLGGRHQSHQSVLTEKEKEKYEIWPGLELQAYGSTETKRTCYVTQQKVISEARVW